MSVQKEARPHRLRHPETHAARPWLGRMAGKARLPLRAMLRLLPRNAVFNFLFHLIYFVYANGRVPRSGSGLLNDYLFFMKTDGTLEDALVQVTTDKVYSKHFIDSVMDRRLTPETYAVFESVDAIRREDLPERCVLKPAHGTDQLVVFLDGRDSDLTDADYAVLRRGLARDVYRETREVNYRHLRKRIICEELIGTPEDRVEYKFLCFRGTAKAVYTAYNDLVSGMRLHNYYDRDWNRLGAMQIEYPLGEDRPMPDRFPEMREIADRLAAHFAFVRVDMYLTGDRLYVGELTHCHQAANGRFATFAHEKRLSAVVFG